MKNIRKKTTALLQCLLLLSAAGCASVQYAKVSPRVNVHRNEKIFIEQPVQDKLGIHGVVSGELEKLGFMVVGKKEAARISARYYYGTGWDLGDYITRFDIKFIDSDTGEFVASATYDNNDFFHDGWPIEKAVRKAFATLHGKLKLTEKPKAVPAESRVKTVTAPAKTDQSARWAVIIGISNYADHRIPSLRYAASDARALHEWAISPDGGKYAPSRVKLLLNDEANFKNIRNALFVWLKQALEEDMVTIYFAGHGSPDSPDSPDNLFLLPSDARYDNIATTGFPMWDIETALKRFIKAKKVVVLADACHAGGVGASFDIARRANRGIKINPISSGIQNLSQVTDGVCVISASNDKQFSQESQKWGGGSGVFTHFLLSGLKGDADYNKDSAVTLGELTAYLSEKVRRETNNAQSPTISGRYDPALTIGR